MRLESRNNWLKKIKRKPSFLIRYPKIKIFKLKKIVVKAVKNYCRILKKSLKNFLPKSIPFPITMTLQNTKSTLRNNCPLIKNLIKCKVNPFSLKTYIYNKKLFKIILKQQQFKFLFHYLTFNTLRLLRKTNSLVRYNLWQYR